METREKINKVIDSIKDLLFEKNKRYGDSALNPLDVFTAHVKRDNPKGVNLILIRLDDKLKRIKNSSELRKNDVADVLGYVVLLCGACDWLDFSDLID